MSESDDRLAIDGMMKMKSDIKLDENEVIVEGNLTAKNEVIVEGNLEAKKLKISDITWSEDEKKLIRIGNFDSEDLFNFGIGMNGRSGAISFAANRIDLSQPFDRKIKGCALAPNDNGQLVLNLHGRFRGGVAIEGENGLNIRNEKVKDKDQIALTHSIEDKLVINLEGRYAGGVDIESDLNIVGITKINKPQLVENRKVVTIRSDKILYRYQERPYRSSADWTDNYIINLLDKIKELESRIAALEETKVNK